MKHFTLRVRLRSPLLAGGQSTPVSDVDLTTAVDARGKPYLPASALRGALREACVRLENARAADGVTADPWSGGPLTRSLFGEPGRDRPGLVPEAEAVHAGVAEPERSRCGFRVGDAKLESGGWDRGVRPGVAISRQTQSAQEGLHYQVETFDVPDAELVAACELDASPEAEQLLLDALSLVDGVGRGRSRGLGWVELELVPREAPRDSIALVQPPPPQGVAVLDVLAVERLVLGGLRGPTNVRESLELLPGSMLRGALAAAVLASGTSPEDDVFRRAFVDPSSCLLFSDVLPVGKDAPAGAVPTPLPRSLLACRRANEKDHLEADRASRKRGVRFDTLVLSTLQSALLERGGFPEQILCPVCKSPLRPTRRSDTAVRQRVVTRVGRDVGTGSFMDGLLYSTVEIEPDTRFRGTVARLDAAAQALLARASTQVIRVGGLRSRGLGTVKLSFAVPGSGVRAVERRLKSFRQALQPWMPAVRAAAVPGWPEDVDRIVPVLARTDIAHPPEASSALLAETLRGRVLASFQTTSVRSGWDDRAKEPRTLRPVVAAGSAWLLALDAKVDLDLLARLESEGIGDDRHLGMGRLAFASESFEEGLDT
ncbi:MAG: hypothetical protein OHK0013_01690 [Sandaracinaceae bacterium]